MLTKSLNMNTYTVNNVEKAINALSLNPQRRLPLWGICCLKIVDNHFPLTGVSLFVYETVHSVRRECTLINVSLPHWKCVAFRWRDCPFAIRDCLFQWKGTSVKDCRNISLQISMSYSFSLNWYGNFCGTNTHVCHNEWLWKCGTKAYIANRNPVT